MNLIKIFILIFCFVDATFSQVDNGENILLEKKIISDTTIYSTKSPTFAMLASAAIPGFGQIYNESWWKAPVVWGFTFYFGKIVTDQNKEYKYWKTEYENSNQKNQLYRYNRDFFHDQRDQFAWYLAVTYILNIVDAYVDASLYNFEVSPELNKSNQLQLSLKLKF
ncbi:MAG: DUF5683 domain-containing protein [Bacteroidetes bacterium]|nr:DUF5683 domain-containing protein [Bacteroidota bacterium]